MLDATIKPLPTRALGLAGGGSLLAATVGAGLMLTASPASAATFTVTNLNDAGAGSLRQAILDANAVPTDDVIEFAPGLSGTISLTTGEMKITDELSLIGPGSANVTIDAANNSQIFYIYDAPHVGALNVTISGLTLTRGVSTLWGGGAIASWSANTTLRDITITNSNAPGGVQTGRGGAILHALSANQQGRDAILTLENCNISGNTAGYRGGGVALYLSGGAHISDSVIEGNTAVLGGGGIYEDSSVAQTTITRSRISGNTAADGGGIRIQRQDAAARAVLDRVSVVGNTSTGQAAAAISLDHTNGATDIVSSTIADNAGGGVGGADATALRVLHSTVVGNSGTGVRSFNRGMSVNHSILADNTSDLGSSADVNWSLVETGGSNIVAGGNNLVGVDPAMQPLLQFASTIWVRPLLQSSAAFNAGDPAFAPPPAIDQTGRARVVFGRIDMGAFELQIDPPAGDDPVVPTFTG